MITIFLSYQSPDFWCLAYWGFLLKIKADNLATVMWLNKEQEESRYIPLSLCPEACIASTHNCQHLPYNSVMDPSSGPALEKDKWLHQGPATAHSKSTNSQITWNDPITAIFIPNVS